jgi:predicted dehydrogenase
VYPSFSALMEGERTLDFIDLAVPPVDHAPYAKKALERGLHVLCEKPLTTNLEDAGTLLRTAVEQKRVLFPCHNYKHAPVVKAISEIIASGQIGRVRSVTLNTMRNTHAKGVTEWRTHWRRDFRTSGGGIAMDHGSHSFYLTFDWLNAHPTAVTAKTANLEPDKYDTEDNYSAVLTFPTGLAHVQLSWTAGVRKVQYAIQGDKGAITVDDDDLQLSTMEATDGPDIAQGAVKWKQEKRSIASHWMDASHTSWFNALFDQFQGAIGRGDFAGAEAQDAYRCIEIITASYRSARDNCREQPLGASLPPGVVAAVRAPVAR